MTVMSHIVQITADNVNVFNNSIAFEPPSWARRARFQLVAPDSDWLFDLSVQNLEMARDSGPHRCQADNLQIFDWASPHIEVSIVKGQKFEPLMDINVVTAGVGLAICQFEG